MESAQRDEVSQLELIGRVLVGVVLVDGHVDAQELTTVTGILEAFSGGVTPLGLTDSLESFDWESFDLEATCKALVLPEDEDKRALLELVADIVGADGIQHEAEVAYLRVVARFIDASPEALQGLT